MSQDSLLRKYTATETPAYSYCLWSDMIMLCLFLRHLRNHGEKCRRKHPKYVRRNPSRSYCTTICRDSGWPMPMTILETGQSILQITSSNRRGKVDWGLSCLSVEGKRGRLSLIFLISWGFPKSARLLEAPEI